MDEDKIRAGCKAAILGAYSEAQQRNIALMPEDFSVARVKHLKAVVELCTRQSKTLIANGASEWYLEPEGLEFIANIPE